MRSKGGLNSNSSRHNALASIVINSGQQGHPKIRGKSAIPGGFLSHPPRPECLWHRRQDGRICLNLKVELQGCLQGEQTKPGQEAGNSTPRTRSEGERAELLREQGSAARLSGTVHHPNLPAPPIQQRRDTNPPATRTTNVGRPQDKPSAWQGLMQS